MKKLAMIVVLAISGFALSSEFTPASASKMNGKCCQSSDGGRSNRHQMAMRRAAMPHTCSAYAAACMRHPTARADGFRMCRAAQAQCLQTGVYIGPTAAGSSPECRECSAMMFPQSTRRRARRR